jgi:phosphonate transport system substrate-binding protein
MSGFSRSLWRLFFAVSILALVVLACGPPSELTATPPPTHTPRPTNTQEPTATATSIPTPTTTSTRTTAPTDEPVVELGTKDALIVWAFVPSSDAARVSAAADTLADLLFEETGLYFEPLLALEYAGAVEAMCDGRTHMSSLPTFSYVMAEERGCADAALVAVRDGSTTYNGQIITRVDSGIITIEGLKGKTFCRPDPMSASGWIVPMLTMKAVGIDPETDLDTILDTGGHHTVVAAVYEGFCDAGATFVDARTLVERDYPDVMEKVVAIAITEDIPNDGVQFAPSMPQDLRDEIVGGILATAETEEGRVALNDIYGWSALERCDDTFYNPFRLLLRDAGVEAEDLAK